MPTIDKYTIQLGDIAMEARDRLKELLNTQEKILNDTKAKIEWENNLQEKLHDEIEDLIVEEDKVKERYKDLEEKYEYTKSQYDKLFETHSHTVKDLIKIGIEEVGEKEVVENICNAKDIIQSELDALEEENNILTGKHEVLQDKLSNEFKKLKELKFKVDKLDNSIYLDIFRKHQKEMEKSFKNTLIVFSVITVLLISGILIYKPGISINGLVINANFWATIFTFLAGGSFFVIYALIKSERDNIPGLFRKFLKLNNIYEVSDETLKNIRHEMVFIEGGEYERNYTEKENSGEVETRKIGIPDFYLSKYLVSQKIWKEVMGYNPSMFKGDALPVENVSWHEANEFIKRINSNSHAKYSLPTEMQWEYAARGGKKSKNCAFAGSDDFTDVGWFQTNSENSTHFIGSKSPNELQLYNMSGNVWEWCQDSVKSKSEGGIYLNKGDQIPYAPEYVNREYRILKGGSWNLASAYKAADIGYTNFAAARERYCGNGFRLAATL